MSSLCNVCGKCTNKRCKDCNLAAYCSPTCQAIDWEIGGHERQCYDAKCVHGPTLAQELLCDVIGRDMHHGDDERAHELVNALSDANHEFDHVLGAQEWLAENRAENMSVALIAHDLDNDELMEALGALHEDHAAASEDDKQLIGNNHHHTDIDCDQAKREFLEGLETTNAAILKLTEDYKSNREDALFIWNRELKLMRAFSPLLEKARVYQQALKEHDRALMLTIGQRDALKQVLVCADFFDRAQQVQEDAEFWERPNLEAIAAEEDAAAIEALADAVGLEVDEDGAFIGAPLASGEAADLETLAANFERHWSAMDQHEMDPEHLAREWRSAVAPLAQALVAAHVGDVEVSDQVAETIDHALSVGEQLNLIEILFGKKREKKLADTNSGTYQRAFNKNAAAFYSRRYANNKEEQLTKTNQSWRRFIPGVVRYRKRQARKARNAARNLERGQNRNLTFPQAQP